MYLYQGLGDNIVIICLYVDDMLIFSGSDICIQSTKDFLSSHFDMKDLGVANTILGIKIHRLDGAYVISQSHYIELILEKFNHLFGKVSAIPYNPILKLGINKGRCVSQLEYSQVIGSLMYAMHCTRPDIAFAVGKLSRYPSCPSLDHWKGISIVLGYLKGTKTYALHYGGHPLVVEGFSDTNWNCVDDGSKSTFGWVFTLGGAAITWASKKQTCITHSTMESELVALGAAGKEAEWIRNLMIDLPLWKNPLPPFSIHCDSQATLSRVYSKSYNGKSRHISLRHNTVRQMLEEDIITVAYIKSCTNLADPFIKGLSKDLIRKTTIEMGLKPI